MKNKLFYCLLFLFATAFIGAPLQADAEIALQKDVPLLAAAVSMPRSVVTNHSFDQDDKQDKTKKGNQKPDVKEVPKSRRQPKPAAVKSKVKIKTPVKKIKPVIKKPLRLVHKNL
ncbi:hypothetical protein GZH53_12820 [Flavihumibacter sp. R14]|nr:hypothetical protein [Flavihumibacter soli]